MVAHARALLTSSPEVTDDYINLHLRDPETILARAARTLDFSQPAAVMLIAVFADLDDDDAQRMIAPSSSTRRPDTELEATQPTALRGGAGRNR